MTVWLAAFAQIAAGCVLLGAGAEGLIRGAAALARLFGISALVIGLTVVAFGTSSPEFAVSIRAALQGQADLSVGNVVGSNIFNIAAILGLAALCYPIPCNPRVLRRDVPIMIGVTVLLGLAAWLGPLAGAPAGPRRLVLTPPVGIVFIALLALYVLWLYWTSSPPEAPRSVSALPDLSGSRMVAFLVDSALIVLGLVGLYLGSCWLVDGSITIARMLGVGELVIGLTVVAAGTSLPELVTSVLAALRREPDISVGNVVGSSIFNVLGVLGVTAAIRPLPVSAMVLRRDLPMALLLALLCLPMMRSGGRVSRIEGALFVSLLAGYTFWCYVG